MFDSLPRGRPDLLSPGPRHGLYTSGLDPAQYKAWRGLQRICVCRSRANCDAFSLDTMVKNLHGRALRAAMRCAQCGRGCGISPSSERAGSNVDFAASSTFP